MDSSRKAGTTMQADLTAPLSTAELVQRLAAIPAANISDAQERIGVASALSPSWPGARLAGPAYTVWTRPGDNLYIHKALEEAQPGDVIVVNGGGDQSRALIGDMIGIRARNQGVAGFVIDGAVRDAEALAECGLPVFARSVTPAGPYKFGPGRLQIPVAIDGVVVAPGDLVVADADGVVVVRRDDAEQVLAQAEAIEAREEAKRTAFAV